MNIINTKGDLAKAMTAYRNELKLEVRVNGKPVVLNNDYQLRQESSPGQPDKFVIELTTI